MKTAGLAILLIVCFSPTTTLARKLEHGLYERLIVESDLVVIATPIGFASWEGEWPDPLCDKERFESLETIFHTNATINGEAVTCIHFVHFHYNKEVVPYNDGPTFVSSSAKLGLIKTRPSDRTDGDLQALKVKREVKPNNAQCLLFLKKREDRTYQAVSGQMDPIFSVRVLFDLPMN